MRGLLVLALVCLSPLLTQADPPVTVPDGQFADYTITVPEGAAVVWRYYPQPIQRAKDLPPGRIIFAGRSGVTYTATAIIVDFNKKTVTDTDYVFVFSGSVAPPPKEKDPPPKEKDPPPPVTGGLYFMVVRVDGPTAPAFATYMQHPSWAALRAKGHKVQDFPFAEANKLGFGKLVPAGGPLPGIIVLQEGESSSTFIKWVSPPPADPLTLIAGQ